MFVAPHRTYTLLCCTGASHLQGLRPYSFLQNYAELGAALDHEIAHTLDTCVTNKRQQRNFHFTQKHNKQCLLEYFDHFGIHHQTIDENVAMGIRIQ